MTVAAYSENSKHNVEPNNIMTQYQMLSNS
jgi:hypothetical protein